VDREGALELGERLREAVGTRAVRGVPVTISLGVAARSAGDERSYAELFDAADDALYEAKRAGRDRVALSAAAAAH
jgi:diguanylate cyclase (GGDEF)-like protein